MANLTLRPVPPWAPKWGTENLRKEAETNPRAFDRGFRMQAFRQDELMFPSFTSCYSLGANMAEWRTRNMAIFVGVDLAGDKRPGNCISVLGLDPATQHRYVLEVLYGAWKSHETAGFIADVAMRYPNLQFIMVENNGYQDALVDWIQHSKVDCAGWWHKVETFTTGRNKADPRYGLPSLEVEFHNKAWVIPANEFAGHPAVCVCNWCTWVREFTQYPKGATSDGIMACWFAREAIHRWGGAVGAGVLVGDLNTR